MVTNFDLSATFEIVTDPLFGGILKIPIVECRFNLLFCFKKICSDEASFTEQTFSNIFWASPPFSEVLLINSDQNPDLPTENRTGTSQIDVMIVFS